MNMHTNLPALRANVVDICRARGRALELMGQAVTTLAEGQALVKEAHLAAKQATMGYVTAPPNGTQAADAIDIKIEAEKALEAYRKQLDANIWTHITETTGILTMMDKTMKDEFRNNLTADVPEATEENITATMQNLGANAHLIFQRGLAKAFIKLDKRFKSHDGFKIGARMIMDRLFDEWGSWNGWNGKDDTLADVERVFAVLDGEKPNFRALREAIDNSRRGAHGARQSETEAAYFKVRGFKNGNAHLWFTRDDLVEKANQVLRAYYGEVLPDAATVNEKPTGTAVATKLQFYPTPPAVVDILLRNLNFPKGAKVLEPEAGEGAITRRLPTDCDVTAIEIHPERAAYIGAICANFLTWKGPLDHFDFILMNPPFFGTHWMEHVRKAYTHLKPHGTLRAILPASAEVNESRAHEEFRSWVEKTKDRWGRPWTSLPSESFASSGTNVETVILEIKK